MWVNIKYIFYFIFISIVLANQKPKITLSPSDIYGLLNQQISLRCDSTSPLDKISWIKDNNPINSNNNNPLIIQLNLENEGYYQCNVSNTFGYTLSEKSIVKVAYLHNFPDVNHTIKYVSPGTTVLLQCLAPDGLPKPKIEWKSSISINNPRFKLDSNNNLRIDNIQRSDAGRYWCEAKNLVFTRTSSSTELIIFQKPVFHILPKHLQVMVSSHILFPCLVIGDSPMFINWYKLGSEKSSVSLSRTSLSTNCSMVINNVRLEDSGAYVCRARNSGGITEIIYKLTVISFPSFTETPENIRAKVGESVFLRCSASGIPAPKVFWYHNNLYYLSDIDNNNRVIVFENGTLLISAVRYRDAGRYFCYAGSFVGVSRTESFLSIDAPRGMFPPVISKVPQNVTTTEGATVIITCQAADPMSSITWYKQSLKIIGVSSTSNRLQLLKNGDLKILSAKIHDSAMYTCRATSGTLFTEKSAFLTVKSYSEVNNEYLIVKKDDSLLVVNNITIQFIGDSYILIKWEYPFDDRFTWFRVEIAEQYKNNWQEVSVTKQKTCLINNLKSDTGYMVSIRPINSNVIGDMSLLPEIVYTLDTPTISVDSSFSEFHKALQEIDVYSVKLTTISSSQVQLTWKVTDNYVLSSISGFIIKAEPVSIKRCLLMTEKSTPPIFSCLESEDAFSVEELISSYDDPFLVEQNKVQKTIIKRSVNRERPQSSAIIGGLKPFRCYEVEIETFIDHIKAGRISGRDSKTKTVLTFDDLPKKAPVIKSYKWIDNTTFYISWDKLDSRFSNGPITGFIIQIININRKTLQTYKIPMNVLQHTFKIESQEMRYILYLSADSCRGQGPRSIPVMVQYGENQMGKSDFVVFPKQWIMTSTIAGVGCGLFLTLVIILIMICKRQKSNHQFPKHGQIPLVSSNKEMENSVSKLAAIQQFNKLQSQKLLSNYETISPDFELTSSDIFTIDVDPHSSTTTVPRFNCSSADPVSCLKLDENRNDSLAYASSSIIYKGCQHYNMNMNKYPPNFYGPYIDILNDPNNAHFLPSESQLITSPLIPPPPMYPPPPAPKNQGNFSDNNSEVILSNQGSSNNTHSSGSTSACGSNSNKSSKTRKSRTPQSVNSSSSSKSQRNRKSARSSERMNKDNSSPSIGGDKKKDSLSNSTHSSQKTSTVNFKTGTSNNANSATNPNGNKSRTQDQAADLIADTLSEQGLTSELSDTDTADADENARDTDSVRVMYKLPMKRPSTPDYSTDSSYPYSMANHYSSVEPSFPSYPNNLPTKF